MALPPTYTSLVKQKNANAPTVGGQVSYTRSPLGGGSPITGGANSGSPKSSGFMNSGVANLMSGGASSFFGGNTKDTAANAATMGFYGAAMDPRTRNAGLSMSSGGVSDLFGKGSTTDKAASILTGGAYGAVKSLFGGNKEKRGPVLVDPTTAYGERVYTPAVPATTAAKPVGGAFFNPYGLKL